MGDGDDQKEPARMKRSTGWGARACCWPLRGHFPVCTCIRMGERYPRFVERLPTRTSHVPGWPIFARRAEVAIACRVGPDSTQKSAQIQLRSTLACCQFVCNRRANPSLWARPRTLSQRLSP